MNLSVRFAAMTLAVFAVIPLASISAADAQPSQVTTQVQSCKNNTSTTPPECTVCAPTANDKAKSCVDTLSSLNLNNLTYAHEAFDYLVQDPSASGCVPCGGAIGSTGSGQIPRPLTLKRFMKFRNSWIRGSLGDGAYLETDAILWLSRQNADGSGRIILYSPYAFGEEWFWDAGSKVDDSTVDGVYHDEINQTAGLRLYNAAGNLVVDQALAVRAVLTRAQGDRLVFEIIQTNADPTADRHGRMVRWEDRNGNGITIDYQVARDAAITGSRDVLWWQNAIRDDAGRTATITIDPASGRIATIGLPGGGTLTYTRDADRNLTRVDHPDGSVSTFARRQDPDLQATVVDIDDPAAGTTHRRKSAWFTNSQRIDPATGVAQAQPAGVLLKVVNGSGEVAFQAWFENGKPEVTYAYWRESLPPHHHSGWQSADDRRRLCVEEWGW